MDIEVNFYRLRDDSWCTNMARHAARYAPHRSNVHRITGWRSEPRNTIRYPRLRSTERYARILALGTAPPPPTLSLVSRAALAKPREFVNATRLRGAVAAGS